MVGHEHIDAVLFDLFETLHMNLYAAHGQQHSRPGARNSVLPVTGRIEERNGQTYCTEDNGRDDNKRLSDQKRTQQRHSLHCMRSARASPTTNSEPVMKMASSGRAW